MHFNVHIFSFIFSLSLFMLPTSHKQGIYLLSPITFLYNLKKGYFQLIDVSASVFSLLIDKARMYIDLYISPKAHDDTSFIRFYLLFCYLL